jgi:hypothetical protein
MLAIAWRATPKHDRDWSPEHAALPIADFVGEKVHIRGIRDFSAERRLRHDAIYDLDQIESAWFVLKPFSARWRGAAHSLVSFGFADGRYLAISVEARRERDERYGMLAGLFNRFELIYVIGEERDLIGRRIADDTPLYLYPVRAPRERIRAAFVGMLARANRLRTQPEFYNTLANNCSSNLLRHVNEAAGDSIAGGLRTVMPGYTDAVALELGLLETDLPLTEARERFRIPKDALELVANPRFSARLRERSH